MNRKHCPMFAVSGHLLIFFTAAILAAAAPVAADVTARAYVDQAGITLGESVQLRVTLSDVEQGTVDTGSIVDFKVYPRGTSTSVQWINGKSSRKVIYSYMLIPTRSGTLTIPALAVEAGGRTLHTGPIEITVNVQDKTRAPTRDRDVWVSARVSDEQPYSGQQINYSFKLFHALEVSNARFSAPEFKGFEARKMEDSKSYSKLINGREYSVIEVQYILTPKSPGAQVIEPAMLQVNVLLPDQQRPRDPLEDFFNSPFMNRGRFEPRVLQSAAVNVNVRPLPPYDGSGSFSGLVGRFSLKAEAEKTDLKVGDSTTVNLTLAGKGNLPDAPVPDLSAGDAFKVYTDTPAEEIHLTTEGYTGKRVFRTALVPVRTGSFTIPPVSLTYFDTGRQAYQTLATEPIRLQVAPGENMGGGPVAVAPDKLPALKKKVEFTGRDILPPKEGLDALTPRRPLSPAAFALWLILPMGLFAAVVLLQRLRLDDAGPAAHMKARARQALKAADAADAAKGNQEVMLGNLYQALLAAILASGGQSGQALTLKEAETLLHQAGRDPETTRAACDLFARIEAGKYSGAGLSAEQARDLLQQTRTMVKTLTS